MAMQMRPREAGSGTDVMVKLAVKAPELSSVMQRQNLKKRLNAPQTAASPHPLLLYLVS
jgi:hypothetical protein